MYIYLYKIELVILDFGSVRFVYEDVLQVRMNKDFMMIMKVGACPVPRLVTDCTRQLIGFLFEGWTNVSDCHAGGLGYDSRGWVMTSSHSCSPRPGHDG